VILCKLVAHNCEFVRLKLSLTSASLCNLVAHIYEFVRVKLSLPYVSLCKLVAHVCEFVRMMMWRTSAIFYMKVSLESVDLFV
jgi:hypothetical protein